MQLVYATTNPGKFSEVKKIFAHHNLNLYSLMDFNVKLEVEETGNSLKENAALKANAYLKILPDDCIVIGDDTGIEIDALGGEPGIKVRRWKGYKMSDAEIIEYCLMRMKGVDKNNRGAQFHTVLAIAAHNVKVKYFEGKLRGRIIEEPRDEREEGMPFWPIFYIPKLKMTLGEFHSQPMDYQINYPTHREKAVLSALPYFQNILLG